MSDEETTKQDGEEQTGAEEDNDEGSLSKTAKEIELLNTETERLNKAIAEKANADARAKISGVTDAGVQPVEKKEESPEEYAKRVLKGEL